MRVDIWSDIACPWCYIGKRRFEAGVAAFNARHPEVQIEVEGHSYELSPDLPVDFDGDAAEFFAKKGFPREQLEQMHAHLGGIAEAEGIPVDFDRVKHANTAAAHRVLQLAKRQGRYDEASDRMYRAYFADGVHMRDSEAIADAMAEIGLDRAEVLAAFADEDDLGAAVDADVARAQALGITGVPFFLIDEKYGISGAQSAEAFAGAFEQVLELTASPQQ